MDQYWLSATYAARGDKPKALASLQAAFKLGFGDFAALDASPYFASLRDDPRYRRLGQQHRKKEILPICRACLWRKSNVCRRRPAGGQAFQVTETDAFDSKGVALS